MKFYNYVGTSDIISETELKKEFQNLKREFPDEFDYSFSQYVLECTGKNGTLIELPADGFAICNSCGSLCFTEKFPEIVFRNSKTVICERCSIDWEEDENGNIICRESI